MDKATKEFIKTLPDISCSCGSKMFTPVGTTRDLAVGQRTLVYMQFGYQCTGCGSIITMQLTAEGKFLWIPNIANVTFAGPPQ
jgi:DNA-directed RNA polymerase subunit RPC12/RpoP